MTNDPTPKMMTKSISAQLLHLSLSLLFLPAPFLLYLIWTFAKHFYSLYNTFKLLFFGYLFVFIMIE